MRHIVDAVHTSMQGINPSRFYRAPITQLMVGNWIIWFESYQFKLSKSNVDALSARRMIKTLYPMFLMSSYPSPILAKYAKENGWYTKKIEQTVSVANGTGSSGKKKIEVLAANYDMSNPRDALTLFFKNF